MKILNKKAHFNYNLFDRFEAGLVLTGNEAKTIKTKGIDLNHSYAKIIGGEAYLINANIPIESEATRSRKLLLKKPQIEEIEAKAKQKKLTLIPTKVYTRGRLVKAEIALAKAKRKFQKKQSLKKKDVERDIERELKN